jgi:hypothetical protein
MSVCLTCGLWLGEVSLQLFSYDLERQFLDHVEMITRHMVELQFPCSNSGLDRSMIVVALFSDEEDHSARVDLQDILSCRLVGDLIGIESAQPRQWTMPETEPRPTSRLFDRSDGPVLNAFDLVIELPPHPPEHIGELFLGAELQEVAQMTSDMGTE